MMNKEFEGRVILELKAGSMLYGLNTPESDVDFMGVFIPTKEDMFSLKSRESEVDLSVVSKSENNKNDKDAIDRKFMSLHKYVKLASGNNPNVLELLFAREDAIVQIDELGRKLLGNRSIFLNDRLVTAFVGFSQSQRKKLLSKSINHKAISSAMEYLGKLGKGEPMPSFESKAEFKEHFKISKNKVYKVADIDLSRNITVGKALKQLREVASRSNRVELLNRHGYDTKAAYHMIRMLVECKELVETRDLIFPLKEKDMIMEIKKGKSSVEEVITLAKKLEEEIKDLHEKNPLPKRDDDKINELLLEIYGVAYNIK